jgi:hypothetical protein
VRRALAVAALALATLAPLVERALASNTPLTGAEGHPRSRLPLRVHLASFGDAGLNEAAARAVDDWNAVARDVLGVSVFARVTRVADAQVLVSVGSADGSRLMGVTELDSDGGVIRLPVRIAVSKPEPRGQVSRELVLYQVLAHELGHALSGHAVYRTMAYMLTSWMALISWLPAGVFALRAIIVALREWQRKSELSADRAGLLAGQDVDAVKRALMKLAGGTRLHEMDTEAFLEQAREYDATGDVRDGLLKFLNLLRRSHPFAVIRFAEIDRWEREGEYRRILEGEYPRRTEDGDTSVTDEAKNAANSYRESWSRSADPFIGVVRDVAEGAAGAGERIFQRFGRRDNSGSGTGSGTGSGSGTGGSGS